MPTLTEVETELQGELGICLDKCRIYHIFPNVSQWLHGNLAQSLDKKSIQATDD